MADVRNLDELGHWICSMIRCVRVLSNRRSMLFATTKLNGMERGGGGGQSRREEIWGTVGSAAVVAG